MKTVIEMAREAGFAEGIAEIVGLHGFERFAELVRADAIADEREACAKVCDGLADMHAKMDQWGSHKTADTLAQAIRAGATHDRINTNQFRSHAHRTTQAFG